MPRSPTRSPSNWPTLLVAGLLVVSTGGFIAHQKGWIPPELQRRANQVVLAISGRLPEAGEESPAEPNDAATLGTELDSQLEPAPRHRDEDAAAPVRPVRPDAAPRPRRSLVRDPSELSEEQDNFPEADEPPPPRPVPRRAAPSIPADSGDVVALADGDEFVDDVAERPAPKRTPRTAPARTASVTEPARPAPKAAPAPSAADTPAPSGDLVELADIENLINEEQDVLALQEMTRRYWKMPAERELLRAKMEELSNRIYFSPQPHYFEPHVIQNNEQLRQVAPKYSLSWQYLARLNNTDPKRIRPGQRLKVAPGPFHALVTIRSHELIIHNNGCYVKRYRIGAGKDRSTPIGTFKVLGKESNPTYYGPDGVIKADDPANPLGERWLDIGNSFGIHGTNEPDSIGEDRSRGCIRLTNEDVAEVYDFLVIGSEVKIQR